MIAISGHRHISPRPTASRAFGLGIGLNLLFIVVEATAGWLSGSLVLLADAGHNLSDVAALAMAWGAAYLGSRPPSARRTYGLGRLTVLAALANAILLLVAVGAIALEAIERLQGGYSAAEGSVVMTVAGAGILINGATALLFLRDRHKDLNINTAFQHMAADTAVSFGVVLSGALILATGYTSIDAVVSLLIAVMIGWSSWRILRSSLHLAVDGVPDDIDEAEVLAYLRGLPGVVDVHDMHIWPLSTTVVALTVHLVRPGAPVSDDFTNATADYLLKHFGIAHATIQIEEGSGPACRLKPAQVV
jgi:cobalt-zinc-cadmium efflux system protein